MGPASCLFVITDRENNICLTNDYYCAIYYFLKCILPNAGIKLKCINCGTNQ